MGVFRGSFCSAVSVCSIYLLLEDVECRSATGDCMYVNNIF